MKMLRVYYCACYSLLLASTLLSCKDDDGPGIPAPSATAGGDQTVDIESLVTLDGSGSSGTNITYSWQVTSPSGSVVTLNEPGSAMPSFRVTEVGNYEILLSIANEGGSTSDNGTVTVVNPTFELVDQMGRPAINTVFNFFNSMTARVGSLTRDEFNLVLPSEGANAAEFAAVLDALQGYIGLDPDQFVNILGIGNDDLAGVLAVDVLTSDKTTPTSYASLNGRGLADDVVDVTLLLAFSDQSNQGDPNGLIPGLISDNVQENDVSFDEEFPYLASPN